MTRPNSQAALPEICGWKKAVPRAAVFVATILIFLSAWFFFYIRGSDYGKPFCLHPDEPSFARRALSILQSGDFNPHFFWYPSLSIYLQSGVSALTHSYLISSGRYGDHEYRRLEEINYRDKFYFYQAGRIFSALLAAGTVLLVYFLSRFFFSRWCAYLAAGAVLIYPLMVEQAHSLVPNVLGGFFVIASVYCAVLSLEKKKQSLIYAGAICAGFACGSKYNLALSIIPVLAVIILYRRPGILARIVLVLVVFAVSFFLTTPYALFDLPAFVNGYCYELHHYKWSGHPGAQSNTPLLFYLKYFSAQGLPFLLFSIFGLISLLFLAGRRALVVISFPFIYFFFITRFQVTFPRNLLFIIPFFGLGFGVFICLLYNWVQRLSGLVSYQPIKKALPPLIVALVAVLTLYNPVKLSLWWQWKFGTNHPTQVAQKWIEENVPAGSRIVCDQKILPALVVPVPGEEFKVKLKKDVFFTQPYITYLDNDYLVSTVVDAYDRYEWLRERIKIQLLRRTNTTDMSLLDHYLTANRDLLEKRFELIARIDDSLKQVKGDGVLIFSIPDFESTVIRGAEFKPDESLRSFLSRDRLVPKEYFPFHWNGSVSFPIHLSPGQYDVFIRASAVYGPNTRIPRLMISLGVGPPQPVEVIFTEPEYYGFTFQVEKEGEALLTISFINDTGQNCDVFLYRVVIVNPRPMRESKAAVTAADSGFSPARPATP
jgi:dolichyl-phosphate-mannose-protein mannosyltransferase